MHRSLEGTETITIVSFIKPIIKALSHVHGTKADTEAGRHWDVAPAGVRSVIAA
jgi:hypothetical protein